MSLNFDDDSDEENQRNRVGVDISVQEIEESNVMATIDENAPVTEATLKKEEEQEEEDVLHVVVGCPVEDLSVNGNIYDHYNNNHLAQPTQEDDIEAQPVTREVVAADTTIATNNNNNNNKRMICPPALQAYAAPDTPNSSSRRPTHHRRVSSIPCPMMEIWDDHDQTYRRMEANCVICLNDYEVGDAIVRSAAGCEEEMCKHVFHYDCMLAWLSQGKKRCPYCRHWFVPALRIKDQMQMAHVTQSISRHHLFDENNTGVSSVAETDSNISHSLNEADQNVDTAVEENVTARSNQQT